MEDEFDDDLDELCSQVPINICYEKPTASQNENVFKKPKYSFNRVQQNRTFNSYQGTQQSTALKSQTHQQNRLNQIGPNKVNQPHGQQNKSVAKPLNAQQVNQRSDSRPTSSNVNNQSNRLSRPGQAAFSKPNASPSALHPNNPGNAPFSNLSKSIVAQNKSKDCLYSINKQFIMQSPSRQSKPAANQTRQPVQSTGSNPRATQHGVRAEASNSTIRSTQSTGFSQFQGKAFQYKTILTLIHTLLI